MRTLKTLVLALVVGIALSPAASATTGSVENPVAKATVVTQNVYAQQSAAQTCSAATFSITLAAAEGAVMTEPRRCWFVEERTDDDGRRYQIWTEIRCPD